MTDCEQRCEKKEDPDKNRCDATGMEARAGADARQQVCVGGADVRQGKEGGVIYLTISSITPNANPQAHRRQMREDKTAEGIDCSTKAYIVARYVNEQLRNVMYERNVILNVNNFLPKV